MKTKLRRSGAKIMASLIVLLGSLSYIMILAVINGLVGFIAAMGVTVAGATGVAKACVGFSDAVCHDLFKRQFHIQAIRGSKFEECVAYTDALYRIDDF